MFITSCHVFNGSILTLPKVIFRLAIYIIFEAHEVRNRTLQKIEAKTRKIWVIEEHCAKRSQSSVNFKCSCEFLHECAK